MLSGFLYGRFLLTSKLPIQKFMTVRSKSSLWKCCDRHHELGDWYAMYALQMNKWHGFRLHSIRSILCSSL